MTTNRLSMYRGDSHLITLTVQKYATGSTTRLIPVDLTGASAVLSVKAVGMTPQPSAYTLQKSGVVTSTTNGTVTFTLVPADTLNLTPTSYVYDVQVTLGDQSVYTVVKDTFVLLEDVTRPVPTTRSCSTNAIVSL